MSDIDKAFKRLEKSNDQLNELYAESILVSLRFGKQITDLQDEKSLFQDRIAELDHARREEVCISANRSTCILELEARITAMESSNEILRKRMRRAHDELMIDAEIPDLGVPQVTTQGWEDD